MTGKQVYTEGKKISKTTQNGNVTFRRKRRMMNQTAAFFYLMFSVKGLTTALPLGRFLIAHVALLGL